MRFAICTQEGSFVITYIQGDQMSLCKNCPKCSPTIFASNFMNNLSRGNLSLSILATFFK
jgi:hypothetical protein